MIESQFVVVTADMGTSSGCRFDWGGILIFGFLGVVFELSCQHDVSLLDLPYHR